MHVAADDVVRIMSTYGPSGPRVATARRSAFWVLLVLSAIIAGGGVIADSTATVIGAMIVAPLMTPIVGIALGLVLADRRSLLRSLGRVLAGAAVVVAVGALLGVIDPVPVVAETNGQVAGRTSPRLIDLISALATGAVGAFAVVRADVSDALPGVAIAISLVPPLAVVGLTLESGEPGQAAGALLLFAANVAAIVATGTAVFLLYRLRDGAVRSGRPVGQLRGRSLAALLLVLLLVAVPLAVTSTQLIQDQTVKAQALPIAREWATTEGGTISAIDVQRGVLRITVVGPPPQPSSAGLRRALDGAGLTAVPVDVTWTVGSRQRLPAG